MSIDKVIAGLDWANTTVEDISKMSRLQAGGYANSLFGGLKAANIPSGPGVGLEFSGDAESVHQVLAALKARANSPAAPAVEFVAIEAEPEPERKPRPKRRAKKGK